MSLCFEGYGCTANQGETLELARKARELGHEVTERSGQADTVVLGTCTVVQATADRMEHRIETLLQAGQRVIVSGCMATADRSRLQDRYPDTPLLVPGDIGGLERLIGRGGCRPEHKAAPVTAILVIASGCLGRCTYCATLRARGRVTSRPLIELVEKAKRAITAGSRELLLTSQDIGAYGADLKNTARHALDRSPGPDLTTLMAALAEIPGDHRIRIGMLNPALAMDEAQDRPASLLEAWADPRVYKFLHLPVQTGSERLLEAMGREHTLEQFYQVIGAFRGRYPELMVATDIICGFPGETEEDHQATLELMERLRPEVVNITRFSPRPFTPAAALPGKVSFQVAKERSRELTRLRQRLGREAFQRRVGTRVRVLATEPGKPGTTICRDESYHPVVVGRELELGTFQEVEVTGATWAYLLGELKA